MARHGARAELSDDRRHHRPAVRPHTVLPQFALHGAFPDRPLGLTFGFDFELANFDHNVVTADPATRVDSGWRIDAAPEVRLPLRGAGVYLEPAASWRYTAYRLDESSAPPDESPSRSAPIVSLDGGLIFERPSGSRGQRLQTLEPRFMYLYVPYRGQDDLPVFDTTPADLNLVQLFRTNRYVGADRLSNANQLTIGFTSRLLDADTGDSSSRRRSARPTTSMNLASRLRMKCSTIRSLPTSSPRSTSPPTPTGT